MQILVSRTASVVSESLLKVGVASFSTDRDRAGGSPYMCPLSEEHTQILSYVLLKLICFGNRSRALIDSLEISYEGVTWHE